MRKIKVIFFFEKVSENALETRAPHSPDIAEYKNTFFSKSEINNKDTIGLETCNSGTTVMFIILGNRNKITQSAYGIVCRLLRKTLLFPLTEKF